MTPESLGLINAVTTLIKAKLALWEAAEVVEDFIGFEVDTNDGPLGYYCVGLGEIEDVAAANAIELIASLREAEKGDA
jgi:hypothetical protein